MKQRLSQRKTFMSNISSTFSNNTLSDLNAEFTLDGHNQYNTRCIKCHFFINAHGHLQYFRNHLCAAIVEILDLNSHGALFAVEMGRAVIITQHI